MRDLAPWATRAAFVAAMLALPAYGQSVRDSAGVRIVENERPTWRETERLALAAKPRLVIGKDADSAYRFRQVRGVMLLRDGRVAVADGGSLQLRVFTPQGTLLTASAGKGLGVGQLLNMHWAQRLPGDTIAVGAGLSTVAFFSSAGQFVRTTALPPRGGRASQEPARLVALLNSRTGVVTPLRTILPRAQGTRWTDSLPLTVVTDSGGARHEIGMFPNMTFEQTSSGPTPVWLAPGGVFAASESRIYAGFGDRYEIRVYTADGRLRSIIRRSWTPTPITADDWEHWVVEWSKLWVRTTGAEREREIAMVRESPWAEQNPAFAEFLLDPSDRLWVRAAHWQDAIAAGNLTDTPAVPSTWSVFDPNGRWLGDVTMPAGFRPFEIGATYVAGMTRSNGTNQVVIYDLRARDH